MCCHRSALTNVDVSHCVLVVLSLLSSRWFHRHTCCTACYSSSFLSSQSPGCPSATRRTFSTQPLEFFPRQSSAMDSRSSSCQMQLSLSMSTQKPPSPTYCHTSHLNSWHPMHHSVTVWSNFCLLQLPLLGNGFPQKSSHSIRMTSEDSLSRTACNCTETIFIQCHGNQLPHNCAMGFLQLRRVHPSASLPMLVLFMLCAAKRRSQLSSGLSSGDTHTCLSFVQRAIQRVCYIVVSLLVQPFPHDRWPCDHPRVAPAQHFQSSTSMDHRVLK